MTLLHHHHHHHHCRTTHANSGNAVVIQGHDLRHRQANTAHDEMVSEHRRYRPRTPSVYKRPAEGPKCTEPNHGGPESHRGPAVHSPRTVHRRKPTTDEIEPPVTRTVEEQPSTEPRRGEEEEEEEDSGPLRTIEFRIISAQDLKKVWQLTGRMCTYAVAYIDSNDPPGDARASRPRTRLDTCGGRNPVWNEVLRLPVSRDKLLPRSLTCLTIDVFCKGGRLLPDKLLGSARVFLSDFLREGPSHNPIHCKAFWIRMPSAGEPQGMLNVWIPPSGRFLHRPFSPTRRRNTPPIVTAHRPPIRRASSLPAGFYEDDAATKRNSREARHPTR